MASITIPTYSNPCISAYVTKGSTNIYLAGVSDSITGQLEVSSIDIANINTPIVRTIVNNNSPSFWRNTLPKACSTYPGDPTNQATAFLHVQQFGVMSSYDANFYPNGTVDEPSFFRGIAWMSPKNFAIVGNAGPISYVAALTNTTDPKFFTPWTGVRLNGTNGLEGTRNSDMQTFPTSSPLVSVGTFTPSSVAPAQGFLTVFDNLGNGRIYTSTAYDKSNPVFLNLLTLGLSSSVEMGGSKLTSDAIPIHNSGSTSYILDKAADGSTVVYSITPGQTNKLVQISPKSNVPPFSVNMAATTLDTKIIIYRISGATATLNSFDPISGTWSGSGLQPPPSPSPTNSGGNGNNGNNNSGNIGGGDDSGKGSNIGAIIGGVVGGLVVIVLVAFLVIRNRRHKKSAAANMVPAEYNTGAPNQAGAVAPGDAYPMTQQEPYDVTQYKYQQQALFQQQQQQQAQFQQSQPLSYQPVPAGYDPRMSYSPYASGQSVGSQASPTIFQAQQQQAYNVFTPQVQNVPGHSQPSPMASPLSYQDQSQTAPVGTPSQTPVVYTPPTVHGYTQ
ncbi:hypothetical protein FBU30_007467 [Linnemannia zychae]|nr:hypothetical protein FBU30_007467 [Linnemannia zychae]